MPRNRSQIRAVQIITMIEELSVCPLRAEVLLSSKASREDISQEDNSNQRRREVSRDALLC